MKHKLLKTIAAASLLTGFVAGAAHATEGWYGRADIGYSFEGQSDFGAPIDSKIGLEHDYGEHLGLGYAFSNGFRLEGELGHRFNQYDDADLASAGFTDGDVHAWSAMANLFYDFNRGGAIEPYVGVGVGAARISPTVTDGFTTVEGDDTRMAWQAMVGAAIRLSPHWALDVGYRYFESDGGNYTFNDDGPGNVDMDYKHQEMTVGLRYQFAVAAPPPPPPPPVQQPPPPPPPPQPVACPQGDYVVYFEWDRSNLNQAALETIDAAVSHARECNISGVTVVGHTDTSGSAQYNIGLSERRASVVRDALVARGISAAGIQTQARGETDLARATRDGVREPLNRRSTITITFQ